MKNAIDIFKILCFLRFGQKYPQVFVQFSWSGMQKDRGRLQQTERKRVDKNCIKLYNIGRACMNCGDGTGGRSLRADPDHRFIYNPVTMKMRRILRRLFMPVTIKDVAALAGVSPSTVSRTCQGPSLYQPPDQGKGQAGHGEAGL